MKIALGVSYNGSQFHGWQRQPDCRTVQGDLEQALSHVADCPITLQGAGRTDTGVHATGQVIHIDCEVQRSTRAWVFGVNSRLPHDVSVVWAKQVDEQFHSRFSALARTYYYYIHNHPVRSSLFAHHLTWQYRPLDADAMHQAAQHLLGEQDFASFRSIQCQSKTSMRCIHEINVSRHGDLVVLSVKANAFLHHMVRNVVGTLMTVGVGKQEPDWIKQVLAAKNRCHAGETAPAYGLYLVHVDYPPEPALPNPISLPTFF